MDTVQLDKLYWYCVRKSWNRDDAEDNLHDALLKALNKEPELFNSPNGYKKLYKYCLYHIYNKNRQYNLRRKIVYNNIDLDYLDVASSNFSTKMLWAIQDVSELLKDNLEKQVFLLTAQEYTCIEIGNLLKLKKDKINRIQRILRKKLDGILRTLLASE